MILENSLLFYIMTDQQQQTPKIKTDRLASLYKSIGSQLLLIEDQNDPQRIMELKQIEQDQLYVKAMKEQREKMQILLEEFDQKDMIIQEQSEQLQYLTEQNDGLEQLRKAFQDLIQKSEEDQYAFKRLALEKEVLQKEFDRSKEESRNREQKIYSLRQDNDKLSNLQRDTEITLEKYKSMLLEKDEQNLQQIKQLQGQASLLNDENLQLKQEIRKLDDTLFGFDHVKEQNSFLLEEIKKLSNTIEILRVKNEKQEKHFEQQKSINKQLRKEHLYAEQHINKLKVDHQRELESMVQQMKQLEQSNQEKIVKQKEDEKRIVRLREELMMLQQENTKLRQYEKDQQDATQQLEQRARDTDKAFSQARNEVQELKSQLRNLQDKEEQEKKLKHEIDRVRSDLMSVRESEIEKMNQLFEGFLSTKNEHQHSGLNKKKSSTPLRKKQL